MKIKKLVLAMSLVAVSSVASAGSLVTVFTPSAAIGDAIILQSQVASGVQITASSTSGQVEASMSGSVSPTASIEPTTFAGVPFLAVESTVSSVSPPSVVIYGSGSASTLVTQDALAFAAVPVSAINAIATLVAPF